MDHDGEDVGGLRPAAAVMPRVSVVLPVYNGAASLGRTIDTVLAQTMRDFELIIVDDGSTDATPSVLAAYRDERLRVIRQKNGGITHALIAGCDAASAGIIARQDCGDFSRPERLDRMLPLLENCVVAASQVAYTGPMGEALYTTSHTSKDVRHSLLHAGIGEIQSLPHHGSAVFRTDTYRRSGGYRRQFYFAQDLDLWIRMAALGDICITNEVLYEASIDVRTISSVHRAEQIASAAVAIALRDGTGSLADAAAIRPTMRALTRSSKAKALYFIASCLRRGNDPRWRGYAFRAVRAILLGVSR
jgi:glycosyltransferase involved in cell wall biosynthesis